MQKTYAKPSKKNYQTLQLEFKTDAELKTFMTFLKECNNAEVVKAAEAAKLVNNEGEIYHLYVGNTKLMEGSQRSVTEIFEKQAASSLSTVAMRIYRGGSWVTIRERKRRS